MSTVEQDAQKRLVAVTLDEKSIGRGSADQEHERAIAIYDLLEENSFAVIGHAGGPYTLSIALYDAKLLFDIRDADGQGVVTHILSLTPFKRIIKDYYMICDSYYEAIRTATPDRIEAIDMGRRGLHDEGARLLRDSLAGKVAIDKDTARRLFTLICVLHLKASAHGLGTHPRS